MGIGWGVGIGDRKMVCHFPSSRTPLSHSFPIYPSHLSPLTGFPGLPQSVDLYSSLFGVPDGFPEITPVVELLISQLRIVEDDAFPNVAL